MVTDKNGPRGFLLGSLPLVVAGADDLIINQEKEAIFIEGSSNFAIHQDQEYLITAISLKSSLAINTLEYDANKVLEAPWPKDMDIGFVQILIKPTEANIR